MKYRMLKPDELICEGDEWLNGSKWAKSIFKGRIAGYGMQYRRPIKKKKGSK